MVYQEGKKVKSSYSLTRSLNGSRVSVKSNPSSGIGTPFQSQTAKEAGLVEYAGAGTEVYEGSKKTGAIPIVQRNPSYKPGLSNEGSFTTSTGETVQVRNTPMSESASTERQKQLRANEGRLSENQREELQNVRQEEALRSSKVRNIASDKEAVNRVNQQLSDAGIKNAEDFFNKSKQGLIDVKARDIYVRSYETGTFKVPQRPQEEFMFAPKQTNRKETMSMSPQKVFLPTDYEYQNELRISDTSIGKGRIASAELKAKQTFFKNIEQKYNVPLENNNRPNFLVIAGGVFKGVQNVALSVVSGRIVPQTIGFFKSLTTNPVETVVAVGERAVSNPSEFAGELLAFKGVSEGVSQVNPIKFEIIKDMNIPKKSSNVLSQTGKLNAERGIFESSESIGSVERGMFTQIKVTYPKFITGKKTTGVPGRTSSFSINTPAYTSFLRNNPLYEELLKTEVSFQVPEENLYRYKTVIKKENGQTIIEEVKVPIPDEELKARNIEIVYRGESENIIPPSDRIDFGGSGSAKDFTIPKDRGQAFSKIGDIKNPFSNLGSKQATIFEEESVYSQMVNVNVKPFANQESLPLQSNIFVYPVNIKTPSKLRSDIAQRPSSITGIKQVSRESVINASVQRQAVGQYNVISSLQKQRSSSVQSQTQSQFQSQLQKQSQSQVQVQSQIQSSVQVQKQSQLQKSASKQIQSQIQLQKINMFEVPKPPMPVFGKSKGVFNVPGYNVLVKNRGVFKRINTQPLSKISAINLGTKVVDYSSSASFKLVPSRSPAISYSTKINPLFSKKFYTGKNNVFVEKKANRIDAMGELQEITFKGIGKSSLSRKIRKLYGR